jgi:hypothetical protein
MTSSLLRAGEGVSGYGKGALSGVIARLLPVPAEGFDASLCHI